MLCNFSFIVNVTPVCNMSEWTNSKLRATYFTDNIVILVLSLNFCTANLSFKFIMQNRVYRKLIHINFNVPSFCLFLLKLWECLNLINITLWGLCKSGIKKNQFVLGKPPRIGPLAVLLHVVTLHIKCNICFLLNLYVQLYLNSILFTMFLICANIFVGLGTTPTFQLCYI